MLRSRFIIIIILFSLVLFSGYGQEKIDSTKTYRIETSDGNIFTGNIVYSDSSKILLRTKEYGSISLLKTKIAAQNELKNITEVEGKLWLPNPQSARYFWAPNGYGLEKGSAYYQNIWIFYNQISVAGSDNFSMGAGILPLFLFGGAPTPVFIVPKFSFPVGKDKVNIGTGAFLGAVLGEDAVGFGLLYETTTFGSRDRNTSLGVAWGFSSGGFMNRPIINLSSMLRAGPKSYFITENYYIPIEDGNLVLISLGGRSIIRNISLDYSLWIPFTGELDTFIAVPFLGIAVPLGKSRIK